MEREGKKIPELVSGILCAMEKLQYTGSVRTAYKKGYSDFIEFAKAEGEEYFSTEFGEKYLLTKEIDVYKEEVCLLPKWKIRLLKRLMFVLFEYQTTGTVIVRSGKIRIAPCKNFTNVLNCFVNLAKERGNSDNTINLKVYILRSLFIKLEHDGINEIDKITSKHITEFVKTFIKMAQRTVGNIIGILRQFLSFIYNEQYIKYDFSNYLPHINQNRVFRLPYIWKAEEIERILKCVDRANPIGKRNYAILLLATKLGLRDSDIREMKFENIFWNECCIRILQAKTKQNLELPLSDEVGSAIIDYIQNGRPKHATEKAIFVSHVYPYQRCNNLYHTLQKYLQMAKIEIPIQRKHGLHSLRHTLATKLLEKEVPLETISTILGHTTPCSAKVYLSVDIELLRKCSLTSEVFVNVPD